MNITGAIWSSQDLFFSSFAALHSCKVFDEGQAELVSIWKLLLWRRKDTP